MPACPQCSTEVAEGQRFCPNCGARQPDPPPAQPGATIVLPPPPAAAPTARLDPPQPESGFGLPPAAPTQPTPQPQPSSYSLPSSPPPQSLPPGVPPAAPQPVQGKTNWGMILGIIGGVLVLGCIAVFAIGAFFVQRAASTGAEILTQIPLELTANPIATVDIEVPTINIEIPTVEIPDINVPTGAEVFSDDFANGPDSPFSEDDDADSTFNIENGVYVQTLNRENYFVWGPSGNTFSDVAIEVEATVDGPTGGSAAIIFRYVDAQNFLIWRVFQDGSYSLERYLNDELTELIEPTSASALNGNGQPNLLRVETVGRSIKLYANGELIGTTSDASFDEGDMALGVSAEDQAGVAVTWDNLSIRELP